MALRAAVANGNWSLASTWNGGVLPSPGDVVGSNGFTVTIDQNINVDSITNAATTVSNTIPAMTSNTAPSGIASASNGSVDAYRAFLNANSGSVFLSYTTPFWLSYEFTSPKIIDRYEIAVGIGYNAANTMRDWTFEGWNGTSWVVLHTVTNYLAASWSSGYVSPTSIGNTTAYIKYRYNCTAANAGAIYVAVAFIRWYEYLSTSSVAGGGFILNSGVTVTCTGGGVVIGNNTCLTYSSTGSVTINSNFSGITTNNVNGFLISAAGTVTINGNIVASTSNVSTTISVTAAATLNFNGNINAFSSSATSCNAIRMGTSGGILNLVGNIELRGTAKQTVIMLAGTTLNMTGDILCQLSGANSGVGVDANSATINITGNMSITNANSSSNVGWACLAATNICTINIVGTISNDSTSNAMSGSTTVIIGGASYYNHVGAVIGGLRASAFFSTNSAAINIMTGPFVSHSSGTLPIYVTRMHYRRTLGSYYEFRDNSTNGALPPAAAAPETRLNSPEVGSDLPVVTDVRFGTTYGYGSLTGTVRMPTANQVTYGVAVDNTFGAAVLTAASVWDYLVDNITTANSIGSRLKNVSTPQTVGSQLASLL